MDKPMPLASVLQKALKASKIDADPEIHRLWKIWPNVVGTFTAQNARPAAIKGSLLLVNVSSAPWTQQLQYLKEDLIKNLNKALGRKAIEQIRFQIGPVG